MTSTFIIGIAIWLIGAILAWFQIKYWNRDRELSYPEDYIALTFFSLLSWSIYPIWVIQWIYKQIED